MFDKYSTNRTHSDDRTFMRMGTYSHDVWLKVTRILVFEWYNFVYSEINWKENVESGYSDDSRTSSTVLDEKKVYPVFRIYSGVELGFDKQPGSNFLGSFIIEAGYTFIVRYTEIYSNLTEQFSPAPEGWSKSYAIFPGYINLSIGLSFNFQRGGKIK